MKKLYFLLACIIALSACFPKSPTRQNISQPAPQPSPSEKLVYEVGEPMPYGDLEITVTAAVGKERLYTGNPYSTVRAEPGEAFLVLTVKYENKGATSVYVPQGLAVVVLNEQQRHYDSESVLDDHWGTLLKTLNPGTKFSTLWGFRMPKDIQGNIFYWPTDSKTAIRVGQFTAIPNDIRK